ncbi:hypothetical protein E4T44_07745 [Aureobasidium sp. EXF-8845]|nr:hypothetical protein E4T44_07745 [Aureobasidium sp. EXF-8845]KAI4845467.1 hypothetical protein E4T45_07703 [Aureobasidium sp. EXF-8846]
MFTLRQSLGALAAMVVVPLASAIPITTFSRTPVTTFSRIGASSNGMDILNFEIHAAMSPGHLTDNTTMSFTVDTHESLITCTGAWAPEGPFPEGEYISCGNSTMGWNFKEDTYKGMDDFTLQLEYGFIDNSVGEAPYNRVTEFSHANITSTNVDCSVDTQSCQLCNNSTITAIVYASIA